MFTAKLVANFKSGMIFMVKAYQAALSPWLGPACRYSPSCSQYTIEALEKKPIKQAFKLIFFRICSCQPFGGQGYDPVP